MTKLDSEWECAVIINKVNVFYFTGTMQNGALFIPREKEPVFYVRRSYPRAAEESHMENIHSFNSFRDVAEHFGTSVKNIYAEKEFVSLAHFERMNKHLKYENVLPVDYAVMKTRSKKSEFEMSLMRRAGGIHREVLEDVIPNHIKVGMSEADLAARIMYEMMIRGHHGIARLNMFNTELFLGNVCFGESSINHNTFDGPGGIKGNSPAVPLFGSPERKLGSDELIFVDVGCGVEGYNTDKTMIYATGTLPDIAYKYHEECVSLQNRIAERLVPGAIPSEIYEDIMNTLEPEFAEEFMGFGEGHVKFLGHGVGLVIDEYPVIAKGFDEPFEENTAMALEPKRGIKGVGMVGVENTFAVTGSGGKSLTGNMHSIITV